MKLIYKSNSTAGFAAWEGVLVVVVVAVIAAVGYYVYNQRNKTSGSTVNDTSLVAPLGTTEKTVEVSNQEIEQESETYGNYDAQSETNAVSDSAAMTKLEGAGNDTSL